MGEVRSKTVLRLYRRLLEISNEFDKSPLLKSLYTKPAFSSEEHPKADIFFSSIFPSNKQVYVPYELNENNQITPINISFVNSSKVFFRSLGNVEEKSDDYWSVIRSLSRVKNFVENNKIGGFLNDKTFYQFSSEPTKYLIDKAKHRIENPTSKYVTLAKDISPGIAVVAHPMFSDGKFRNIVSFLEKVNHSSHEGFFLNCPRPKEDFVYSEHHFFGGPNQKISSVYYSPEAPVAFSLSNQAGSKDLIKIKGKYLAENYLELIKEGHWIPVVIDPRLVVSYYEFARDISLSSVECSNLRRIFWEEVLTHLGGEYVSFASLSSALRRYSIFLPE